MDVYTDRACYDNGKTNAQCRSRIWFGPDQERNRAIRVPENAQSNQVGEIAAIIAAAEAIPPSWPLKIHTDSQYVIDGLTTHLSTWEDNGWIGIRNAELFKKAAYVLKKCSTPTYFQWVKGHSGIEGNEECNQLAKEGTNKDNPDDLNLDILMEFDLQGAKLATLTQAIAYKGILEQKAPHICPTTSYNLERSWIAIADYTRKLETDENIWRGLQKPTIRTKIQQFLYKAMHETQKIGSFWTHIQGYKDRQYCPTCGTTESMDHILIACRAGPVCTIWNLAKESWPQENPQWPEITLGTILGCGSITSINPPNPDKEGNQE